MTPFEFLLALYVILAGFGLTLLVRSVGQIIEARENVQTYWIHTAWIGFIFIIHITNWFTFWEFRHVETWSVGRFLLLISLPTLLYLISHICVPEVLNNGTKYDLRSYFYERHRTIMGLLAITMVLNLVNDYFLMGTLQFSTLNIVRLIVLTIVTIGALSNSPRMQASVVIALAIITAFSTTVIDSTLT